MESKVKGAMSTQTSDNNKRIAKNTMYMYMRLAVIMLVQLYTSRIVLQALEINNYGIYNVVGTFINANTRWALYGNVVDISIIIG